MLLKISLVKWRPFCPGGDELIDEMVVLHVYEKRHLSVDAKQSAGTELIKTRFDITQNGHKILQNITEL